VAIPPLNRAIVLNPKSEVAYYQLARALRAVGDIAAQEKALAMFKALRDAAAKAGDVKTLARPEVTKQKLDGPETGKPVR
jgi:predicted Zn-dependent protease